jgi:5,10-methylene-tetrahydrofolate dehydrogenase/methenyl tetrahydrofolate cyclohydrolase
VFGIPLCSGLCHELTVTSQASIYVPSVGQMTIAMLQRNLLRLRKYREMAAQKEEEKLF